MPKIKIPEVTTIDFETESIESRPLYPPVPVGVSIIEPSSKKAKYYAWGHPTGNNCTKEEAVKVLKRIWKSKSELLFHHAKFDVDVAQTHMDVGDIEWDRIHDTQYLLFLHDPHALSLSLKPSAERILGMKPEERDEVKEWILANVPTAKPSTWGAFICMAPAKLVGTYANGDTERTLKLFKHLYPKIALDGMLAAYDRERRLMPVLLENERIGMRIDVETLRRDIPFFEAEREKAEKWLRKRLKSYVGASTMNFDSDAEVAEALSDCGIVVDWELTKTGKRSTSKKNMTIEKFKDPKVFQVLGYRNRLSTCLNTFMRNWLEQAESGDGHIHPNWNQVRQPKSEDGDSKGTRTGRPSCDNPNLLNLAKSFEDRGDDYTHPTFIKDLAPLPLVRRYMLPDKGGVWLHRDYNQQELRVLAHFEDGSIMKAYQEDPNLDMHTFVQDEVKRLIGRKFDRTTIKTMNFGKVYGQGLGSLAERLRRTVEEVKGIRDAQNKALPGLPDLEKSIKELAKAGEAIITWGGRLYYVEPPKFVEKFGREMTFEYKLLNYLIQGSSADATKEAIVRFYYSKERKPSWRLLVTVYDEINISAPIKEQKEAMALLKRCMEELEFDVPMISDGKAGKSWGTLEKVKW